LPLPPLPAGAPLELRLMDAWGHILAGQDVALSRDERMATARMLVHRNLLDAAEAQLRAAGADEPAQLMLAALLSNRGKLDEAAQILVAHPGSARAQAELGIIYAKQNRMPEAAGAFQRSLDLDPNQPDVRAWLEKVRQ